MMSEGLSTEERRHEAAVDLLRHAGVFRSEPVPDAGVSVGQWRDRVLARRRIEDLYLDAAERVAAFDPDEFTAHGTLVPAVDWVGVGIDLEVPDVAVDPEAGMATFGRLFVDVPAVEETFLAALVDLGVPPPEVSWTAGTTDTGDACERMVLARPGPADLDEASRAMIAQRVRAATGRRVTVVSGTLPRRVETTFCAAAVGEPTAADDIAGGYRQALAFGHHLARHGLTAVGPSSREVTRARRSFSGDAGRPVTVFDVHPGPGSR